MKSVLISIHPEWCSQIENGLKTIEIRKSRPKISTPFKCYIYCASREKPFDGGYIGLRKVIGEFCCNDIEPITPYGGYWAGLKYDTPRTCYTDIIANSKLSPEKLKEYLRFHKGYAWHISDLVIYDKPKELSEFRKHGFRTGYKIVNDNRRGVVSVPFTCENAPLQRPPQSWCYVQERVFI